MADLTEMQMQRLSQDANNGSIIRAFCSHPGFKLYEGALKEVIEDKKNLWLKGSDEEAKTERIKAQGVQKALDILKQFMLLGDNSNRLLNQQKEEQI